MTAVHPDDLSFGDAPIIPRTTMKKIVSCVMCFLIILSLFLAIYLFWHLYASSNVNVPRLEIDSLSVSNLNLSSRPDQISANWNVQMRCKPVDKHGYFNFSNIKMSICYNDKIVGVTNLKTFDIGPEDPPMHFGGEFFSSLSDYIDDSMIGDISQSMNLAGTLKFKTEFSALVNTTYRDWWKTESWGTDLRAYNCENVELIFGSSDASKAHILNGSHKCQVVEVEDI